MKLLSQSIKKRHANNIDEMSSKISKQIKQSFIENLVSHSSKKMMKEIKRKKAKGDLDAGFYEEDDAKNTNRTDNDEADSDVTIIHNKQIERKKRL